MTMRSDYDEVRQLLVDITPLDVTPARAARIRGRAHEALAHRTQRGARAQRMATWWLTRLEPAGVVGLSAAFLVDVARRAVWLWRP